MPNANLINNSKLTKNTSKLKEKALKVLWFSIGPTPEMAKYAGQGNEGYGAHWVGQLSRHFSGHKGMKLGIATAYPELRECVFEEGGVKYYVIGQPRKYPVFGMRPTDLEKCLAIIEDFKPDLIHIHGSERFFGLIKSTGRVNIPTVISIQGLLCSFSMPRHFFGALSPLEILKSMRLIELPVRLGLAWQYWDAVKGAQREAKMLAAVDGLFGRTEWDRAHARKANPKATYCHVGEILRPAFYQNRWSVENCERFSLIYTNAQHPCRGTENLLEAVALLRHEFPAIKLRLAGRVSTRSGYGRFIRKRIRRLELEDKVEFLGYIDDVTMAQELKRSHVFTLGSYIENSPNSLAEAMILGLPCVASFVGGVPSIVDDGVNGLLYPVEDVPLLVEKIRTIFLNDTLAEQLGIAAHTVAVERHSPNTVIQQLLTGYAEVLQNNQSKIVSKS